MTTSHPDPASRAAFVDGLRAGVSLMMGVIPFGMVCGAAAAAAGLTLGQGAALSWMVFAGASQLVFAQLYAADAPALVIIATAAIVNLRFLMYSAALAPHLSELTLRKRWLAAYLLTDQAFALTMVRTTRNRAGAASFYMGLASVMWLTWQISSIAGIFLGEVIPPSWSMDFVVALVFIAVLAPMLRDPRALTVMLVAGAGAVLFQIPLKLNLISATLLGVATGLALEKIWKPKR